ncbi:uncharacterized protein LOC122248400 [Penaeus japonicus]|uniref:uncharacterized protein LOC122248400 n=1 Tax=Penaeus japonicus TaxID=27405 RepID=UPI001C714F62|nr:uncharacterized protein LOC122248400 [Penaeus japonicus]
MHTGEMARLWCSLTLAFVHLASALTPQETRAFGLQTDVQRPASTKAFVRYDFRAEAEERPPLTKATLCYRFSIARYRSIVPFVSYAYSDKADNAILAFQSKANLDFYYNDEKETPEVGVDDTLEAWNHHCLVFSHPMYRYTYYQCLVIYERIYTDTMYQAQAGQLVQRQQYYGSFNCHFGLFNYPFDTQSCSILIKLASADTQVVVLRS